MTSISRRGFGRIATAAATATLLSTRARAAGNGLRVRMSSDVGNFDPARIFQVENQTIAGNIYNGLVKFDQTTNKIVPDLATGWEISPDARVYTFKLRAGVEWHKNYGPFTADDVKFSFERVKDPKKPTPYAGQFDTISAIDAVDPLTVRITLSQPNPGILPKLAAFNQGWVVSRRAVTTIGDDRYRLQPIGTGPFVFERWSPGNEVRLSANPKYFEGASSLDSVVFRIIKDETAAAIALQNGEIDVFYELLLPEVIARLHGVAGIKILQRDSDQTQNLVLNMTRKPLDDVRVRQAIAYGLNRQALLDGFFKGTRGGVPPSVMTKSFVEYTDDVPKYPFDPDRARALLKEAGAEGFPLTLTTSATDPQQKVMVALAADLSAIGIKTTINLLERGSYLQARAKGDLMTCYTGVAGPPDPDSPIITLFAKQSFPPGLNTSHYDGVEDLLAKLAVTQDADQRRSLYHDILRKTMTDLPVIPIYAEQLLVAHSEHVQGLVLNSLNTLQVYGASVKA